MMQCERIGKASIMAQVRKLPSGYKEAVGVMIGSRKHKGKDLRLQRIIFANKN